MNGLAEQEDTRDKPSDLLLPDGNFRMLTDGLHVDTMIGQSAPPLAPAPDYPSMSGRQLTDSHEVKLSKEQAESMVQVRIGFAELMTRNGPELKEKLWAEKHGTTSVEKLYEKVQRDVSIEQDDEITRLVDRQDEAGILSYDVEKLVLSRDVLLSALLRGLVRSAEALIETLSRHGCLGRMKLKMTDRDNSSTALHLAVKLGELSLVKRLLEGLSDSDRKRYVPAVINVEIDEYRRIKGRKHFYASLTAFQIAALHGYDSIVEYFIKQHRNLLGNGVDQEMRPKEFALSLSLLRGHYHIASLLLAHFSKEHTDPQGLTILHYATLSGSLKTVRFVLHRSVTSDFDTFVFRNVEAQDLLTFAVHLGNSSVEILDALICQSPKKPAISMVTRASVSERDTFLHILARDCSDDMASKLTRHVIKLWNDGDGSSLLGSTNGSAVGTPRMNRSLPAANHASGRVAQKRKTKGKDSYILDEMDSINTVGASAATGHRKLLLSENAARETPFLLAVKHEKVKMMLELAREVKLETLITEDMYGQHAFCYATSKDAKDLVLINLMEIVRMMYQIHVDMDRLHDLGSYVKLGREKDTPLHVAAMHGNLKKTELVMFYLNFPDITNGNDDNFLHCAARHGRLEILMSDLAKCHLLNQKNKDGNTPLHVACLSSQEDAAQALIERTNLSIKNSHGETPFHVAALNPSLSMKFVSNLFAKQSAVSVDVILMQDDRGRTALHNLAATAWEDNPTEIFDKFIQLHGTINVLGVTDQNGDSPLHIAIQEGHTQNVEALVCRRANLNITNNEGFTLLHEAVISGSSLEVITLLLDYGVNLHKTNDEGKNALHLLVDMVCVDPDNERGYVEVFKFILDNCSRWYENFLQSHSDAKRGQTSPKSTLARRAARCSSRSLLNTGELVQLTKAIHILVLSGSDQVLPVLHYAAEKGCSSILHMLMTYKGIFLLEGNEGVAKSVLWSPDRHSLYYDVTDYLCTTSSSKIRSEADVFDSDAAIGRRAASGERPNLVQLIVESNDMEHWKMLELEPLRSLIEGYWVPYRILYTILFIVHVVYMVLFCHYTVSHIEGYSGSCYNATEDRRANYDSHTGLGQHIVFDIKQCDRVGMTYYALVALWPVLVLLANFSQAITACVRYRRRSGIRQNKRCGGGLRTFEVIEVVLVNLLSYVFALMTIIFLVLHHLQSEWQVFFLTLAVLSGWMFTINFTKGFKALHYFIFTLQKMVFEDVFKFSIMFLIFFLAYAYAFHIIVRHVPAFTEDYELFSYTVFKTFNLAVGFGDFFQTQHHDQYQHRLEGFFDFVGASFLVIFLVLLNLLIAVMNDSFNRINVRSKLHWKVNKLHQALELDDSFPILGNMIRRVLKRMSRIRGMDGGDLIKDTEGKRYFLRVKNSVLFAHRSRMNLDNGEVLVTLNNLVASVAKMKAQIEENNSVNVGLANRASLRKVSPAKTRFQGLVRAVRGNSKV